MSCPLLWFPSFQRIGRVPLLLWSWGRSWPWFLQGPVPKETVRLVLDNTGKSKGLIEVGFPCSVTPEVKRFLGVF